MRKLLFITLLTLFACGVEAQTVYRNEVIKSLNGGAVKLMCLNGMYKLTIRTDNRYQPSFNCMLGNRDNAIRLLRFMSELKLTKNDVVDLENATENTLRLGLFGNLEIFSEGGTFSGLIAKKQCRQLAELLEETRDD